MNREDIVELSHRMIPGQEHFKLETRTYDVTDELPEVVHRADVWYVLSKITMSSHVGTHIEFPYHRWQEGADAAEYAVEDIIGEGESAPAVRSLLSPPGTIRMLQPLGSSFIEVRGNAADKV